MTKQAPAILSQSSLGYQCQKGFASWMPKEFQAAAQAAAAELTAYFQSLTVAELKAFIESKGGIPSWKPGTVKADHVTHAWCLKYAELFPVVEVS
jgi:hypothetical protein